MVVTRAPAPARCPQVSQTGQRVGVAALQHAEQGKKKKNEHRAQGSKCMLPACRSSSPALKLLLLPFAQLMPDRQ